MVCMLGDFVTRGVIGGHYVPPEPIAAALSHNWRAHREVDSALDAVGIRVLKDTAVRVATPSGSVWLLGVGDLASAPHDAPRSLLPVTDDTTPVILLTHNPDLFRQVPGRVLLTLAGHTHGGQVRLPLIGSPIVPSRYGQRYVRGHIRERGRDLFVSTGIGTSVIPVRFGVPPTIFVLEIARPEQ
jgi:predicted MPP superfamily phosphohydrolase